MPIGCNPSSYRPQPYNFHSVRVIWQDPKGLVRLWKIPRRMKSEPPLMVKLMWRRYLKMQIFLLRSRGAHRSRTHLMIPRKWKSQVLLTSWKPWWRALNLRPISSSSRIAWVLYLHYGSKAKLTISLTSIQDKFARLFMSIAAELWVRGAIDTVEEVFRQVARNFTLRLAEKLAQYICSLTRRAESLATPETECLLYATYWFRPILSELIGAATESADVNRERAPSGPVKVVVTNRPHSRRHNGIELVSGVSAVLAWFPASWASKIAPCFIGEEGGSIQVPQEVAIVCPHREVEGMQRDAVDQVLQAVKFTDKNAPGLNLELDEEFQASNCFTELIRGYTMGVVEPYTMLGLQPTGATRVTLEVIIPSPTGLTPAKWKQTATLCPLDWPSNYSLLRLWHTTKSFHQYAAQLKQQMQHRHMFSHWEINRIRFASRVLFQRPAHYAPEATLMQHVQAQEFPSRRLRKRTPEDDKVAFQGKCNELRLRAEEQEALHPVSFAIGNSWNDTLRSDKQHYLEYTTRSMT